MAERKLTIKMKGKLKDINSFCSNIGGLSNSYDIEIEVIEMDTKLK